MDPNDSRPATRDREEAPNWFSCAFCDEKSPKPFRICESCGTSQPDEPAEKEEE